MTILSSVSSWAKGFNWQIALLKAAVVVVIGVSLYSCGYTNGKTDCQVTTAQAATKAAEVRTVTVVKEVEKRIPVVQIQERDSAALKAELAVTKEKLKDATSKRTDNPICELSDDEFMQFNAAAAATRR